MNMLRICGKLHGELGWPKCVGMLGWLELVCPTAYACLFKLKPGVISKTLSHICGKLNLSIFLFSVGLFTLINIDSLILPAKLCPSLPIIWKLCWVLGWPVLLNFSSPSDLMTSSCWLDESLSSTTNVLFQRIYHLLINLHSIANID